jgi:hypothetical protein
MHIHVSGNTTGAAKFENVDTDAMMIQRVQEGYSLVNHYEY